MGTRPTDWHVLDLDGDPTPGDPERVKQLARELHDFADDVADALRQIKGMAGEDAILRWAGKTAKAFQDEFEDVPKNLKKLQRSYDLAGDALAAYWPKLERAQSLADKALAKGREARNDLTSASGRLDSANSWVERATEKAEKYDEKEGKDKPDDSEVRAAARNATDAKSAQSSAQRAVDNAEAGLEAAKKMAADAKKMREDAASEAKDKLEDASDAGIQNRKWWEKAVDWVKDNWDTIVSVCKVIVAVLGIVVLIIGGPLAWVVLAAALVVLADTLMKYMNGEASLWDVAFAALDCIPGMKGLTSLAKLGKGLKGGLAAAKTGLKGMTAAVKGLAQGIRKGARGMKGLFTCGDPIDIASGDMVMSETDVSLPGMLPLVLERHHRTSVRTGRWFGRSWASTLDQRLRLDDTGVRYVTDDGMVLHYPVPDPEVPVLPVEGPRWPLTWDSSPGGLISVTRADTELTAHFQPVPGGEPGDLPLRALTDRNGNRITVAYDDDASPTAVVHEGGYTVDVTTADGRITALRLRNAPDAPALVRFGYGSDGDLTEVVNSSGHPLTYAYDDRHRITAWRDRIGYWYTYEYDDRGRCTATRGTDGFLDYAYAYDEDARLTTVTNSLGKVSRYQFNDAYQLVAETDPLGNVTRREWDRYDRLVSLTDPLGRTTSYAYDHEGNVTEVTHPDGSVARATYAGAGLPERIVEADGGEWRYTYDDAGNLVAETDPLDAVSTSEYHPSGALRAVTDAQGHRRHVEVNGLGLPVRITDPGGSVTTVEYDPFGRISAVTEPGGARTETAWTPEGLPARRRWATGETEEWTYDAEGNLVEHVDANGARTRTEIGPFGVTTAVTNHLGERTVIEYDTETAIRRVVNPLGQSWEYRYDDASRLIAETDYNGRSLTYRYNAAGDVVAHVNGAGQQTEFVRDAGGATVEKRAPDGVSRFAYDAAGRLVRASNRHAEIGFVYDRCGRLLAEECNGRTVASTYDAVGRRLRRVTPSGAVSDWSWTPEGRVAALTTAGTTVAFRHDALGNEIERRVGPTAVLRQAWDRGRRLVSQALVQDGGAPRREFRYRGAGRMTGAGAAELTLDGLGRVTALASAEHSERYAYDPLGNLTTAQVRAGDRLSDSAEDASLTYTGTLLRTAGRRRYEHDGQGRLVRKSVRTLSGKLREWTYEWDAEDRLLALTCPDGAVWEYAYDPLGRRIGKRRRDGSVTTQETVFAWDGSRLAEETSGGRVTTWDWEPGADRPLTQVEGPAEPGPEPARELGQEEVDRRFYAIVTDLAGTPTSLLDREGAVVWERRATLWGRQLAGGTADAPAPAVHCPLDFPGQYRDTESGLHYNNQRYYDPETSRYLSPDPLGLDPAPNHHGYVANPLTEVDPLGLTPCKVVVRHFTNKQSYQKIMSGGGKDAIFLKAGSPAKGHPTGVYVTPMSPAEILKKPGGFKSFLGLTKEKSEYMIEFEMDKALFKAIRGDRGKHVWYSPSDLNIPKSAISYHGPTSGWTP